MADLIDNVLGEITRNYAKTWVIWSQMILFLCIKHSCITRKTWPLLVNFLDILDISAGWSRVMCDVFQNGPVLLPPPSMQCICATMCHISVDICWYLLYIPRVVLHQSTLRMNSSQVPADPRYIGDPLLPHHLLFRHGPSSEPRHHRLHDDMGVVDLTW